MAWEWLHSQEAYDNLRFNMESLVESGLAWFGDDTTPNGSLQNLKDLEFCVESWAECKLVSEGKICNVENFDVAFMKGMELIQFNGEFFVDSWFEMVESIRLCSNGGHNAYVCPTGCHTLPFEKIERFIQ
jgi:hypothetical protein